jgi:recombination protein RecR
MLAKPLKTLIDELVKLPGIGKKTATRLAFQILKMPKEEVKALSSAIADIKEKLRLCSVCFNLTDSDICQICTDARRDKATICVVEEPNNIIPIEQGGHYKGLYHILMGAISPIHGVGPEDLKVKELIERIKGQDISEIIIANNTHAEGEATAVYISKLIKPLGVKVTRIAVGLPVGSDLEYIDEVTMSMAIEGRREV